MGLLRLKYLNKAIIGTLEGSLEKIKWFVSSKVYCRSCKLYACAKLSHGSRYFFYYFFFVNKIFVIGKPLTKITKNFQLYGNENVLTQALRWMICHQFHSFADIQSKLFVIPRYLSILGKTTSESLVSILFTTFSSSRQYKHSRAVGMTSQCPQ